MFDSLKTSLRWLAWLVCYTMDGNNWNNFWEKYDMKPAIVWNRSCLEKPDQFKKGRKEGKPIPGKVYGYVYLLIAPRSHLGSS